MSSMCRQLLTDFIGGHETEILENPQFHLHLLTVRGRGLSARRSAKRRQRLVLRGRSWPICVRATDWPHICNALSSAMHATRWPG